MATSRGEKLLWDDSNFSKRANSMDALTGSYAQHMLSQSGLNRIDAAAPLVILDNACGNGIVTEELQKVLRHRSQDSFQVTCGDLADAMIDSVTERVKASTWSNVRILKLDIQDTKLPSDHFTHVFTNFAVMLVPKPDDVLDECHRMLKNGGVCALTTWKRVGWVDDIRSAMESIPGLPPVSGSSEDFAKRSGVGDWTDEEHIKSMMTKHGFNNVTVSAVPFTSIIGDEDDLQRLIIVCTSIMGKMVWTPEQQARYDNTTLHDGIERWLKQKYNGGPVEWHWVGIVTTATKH